MRQASRPKASPARRSEAFARFHVRYHIDLLDLVLIACMERRRLESASSAAIEPLRNRHRRLLTGLLEMRAHAGTFRLSDARVAAMDIFAVLTGVTRRCREGGRPSRAEVERAYGDMVMAAGAVRVE